jgi:hypothetical protein
MAFDRDKMMTQTTHYRERRGHGDHIGIVTARDVHSHREEQNGRGARGHLHTTVYARLSGEPRLLPY